MKNNPNIAFVKKDSVFLAESRKFLKENFKGYCNTYWHVYFSAFNGIKDKRYIPEDLFFNKIEPTLNNFNLKNAYTDKNSYDNFIDKKHLPKAIFKIINGAYFDENNVHTPEKKVIEKLLSYKNDLVIKPAIISGQGRNVVIDSPDVIVNRLKSDNYKNFSFIIQEKIKQHKQPAAFHKNSVNTYRITTIRINTEIVVLSAYFRIGRNNSFIDNGMAGGMMCGINKTGEITDYAFDFRLEKMYKHQINLYRRL